MRIVLITGACVACAGLVLVSVASKATATNPAAIVTGPRIAHSLRSTAMRPAFRGPRGYFTTCTSNASTSFNPLPANIAGGLASAVLGYTNQACDPDDTIASGFSNGIGSGGGAYDSFIGGGENNSIRTDAAFIGAGAANYANGSEAFVGGGALNAAYGNGAFIGGGGYTYLNAHSELLSTPFGNTAVGADSFVGAGDLNQISGPGSFIGAGGYAYASSSSLEEAGNQVTGTDSFIGAGDYNKLEGSQGVIGGGSGNTVLEYAQYGTIAGGEGGIASGTGATIGGGDGNKSGSFGTVPGGYHNVATGAFSFAAGYDADAPTGGSFVWSDHVGSAPRVIATMPNQFIARASGGVIFYSNAAQTTGVTLAAGSGTWGMASDRKLKQHVVPLDDAAVLDKVASLPVSEWSYISEGGVRHVGPMAQDFYAAFGVGEDDHHIASIDADGVELAAIKALHAENSSLHATNAALSARVAGLNARLAAVERKIAALGVR